MPRATLGRDLWRPEATGAEVAPRRCFRDHSSRRHVDGRQPRLGGRALMKRLGRRGRRRSRGRRGWRGACSIAASPLIRARSRRLTSRPEYGRSPLKIPTC
eukprot:301368-Pyramimonas_sp.AAC.1